MKVAATNHDPSVILYYFLEAVEQVHGMSSSCHVYTQNILQISIGCPSVLRMDRGTENTKVAALQYAFREDGTDEYAGIKSVRFGTSPANIVRQLNSKKAAITILLF